MRKIVFFDGVCHLCNGFVDAVIIRDKNHKYLFAPLQGSTAEQLLPPDLRTQLDTVVYMENKMPYYRSTAVLKVLIGLGGWFRIFALAWLIPSPLRDYIYSLVAQRRYSWFGKREFCRLPHPEERSYLLP